MSELLMHPMGGGTGSDDVTATAANVLTGKTAVTNDSDDEAIEGTMANNGAMDVTLTPSGNGTTSKEVAEGYYSGGTITADGAAAYSAGHSQGVTDADNRVNTSSASYNSGYNAGRNSLKSGTVTTNIWDSPSNKVTSVTVNTGHNVAFAYINRIGRITSKDGTDLRISVSLSVSWSGTNVTLTDSSSDGYGHTSAEIRADVRYWYYD